jgi:hypothetical protein
MATTTFFDIESAMQTKLNTISGKPYIDFENAKPYTPTIGTRFWRTNNIAGNTTQVTADALRFHTGIYQVDIIVPSGKGMAIILQDMDKIASAFDVVASVVINNTKIHITGVSRSRVTREDSWLYGFVKIAYNCYSY